MPPPREDGDFGDAAAGQLCGFSESLTFGIGEKLGGCSLGDDDSIRFQASRGYAEKLSILAPDPTKLAKARKVFKAKPNPPSTHGPTRPPPSETSLRSGNRRSRAERNSEVQPQRPAARPDPDRSPLLYRTRGAGDRVEPRTGEQTLDLPLYRRRRPDGALEPDPRALYRQNMGQLRDAMRSRRPIRERDPDFRRGSEATEGGRFLKAERDLLEDRGWSFDKASGYWHPPG